MRRRWAAMLLAGLLSLSAGCETDASGSDTEGDGSADTGRDTASDTPADIPSDAPADVPLDAPADIPSDAPADVPIDAPVDVPVDVPFDVPADTPADTAADVPLDVPVDVTVPPGCCLTDADCAILASPVAQVCALPGWGGADVTGVCRTVAKEGWCWRDADCASGQECHGAAVCPCLVDCDLAYEGPGLCVDAGPGCTALDPSWIGEWCDAANLVLWDGTACVETCPGCCACEPFCDLTFQTVAECQTACVKKPCDPLPELAPFQLWAVFPGDGEGMGGADTVSGDAEILGIDEPEPDVGTGGRQITFQLADSTVLKVQIELPAGLFPPLAVGQQVRLFAERHWPWWTDLVVVVWPTYGGWPLFFAQAAAQSSPWYDCDGTTYCPTATFLPSACEPFEMTCGLGVQPPVQLLAAGQITATEWGAVLRQGETTDGYPGYTYGVARAYELTDYQCADYPTPWNASFLVRTYDALKLGFDQENAQLFEFYELCVKKDAPDAEAAVQALDATLYCGVAGVFAGCDAETEVGCHGDLDFVGATKVLTAAKWSQVKALSLLEIVTRINGAHWL